jgi:hypothetical protein
MHIDSGTRPPGVPVGTEDAYGIYNFIMMPSGHSALSLRSERASFACANAPKRRLGRHPQPSTVRLWHL